MSSSNPNRLIRLAVKEFLLSEAKATPENQGDIEKEEELDDFQYMVKARQLVWSYEDGAIEQNLSRLVDNYVKSYKATHGVQLDAEKLYDAVLEQMKAYSDSVNHPPTNFSPEAGSK